MSADEQAAEIPGVEIAATLRPASCLYDSDQARLEVFRTACDNILIVSSNDDCCDAAYTNVLHASVSLGYDDRSEMRKIAEEVGIIPPLALAEKYRDAESAGALSSSRRRELITQDDDDPESEVALLEEISDARKYWEENVKKDDDDTVGLSVTRTINYSNDIEWSVSFSRDSSMTIVLDEGAEAANDQALADIVIGCWDPEWDED